MGKDEHPSETEGRTEMVDRRHFLAGALRGILVAALSGATALLVFRRARHSWDGPCINEAFCGGCPVYDGCSLGPALALRKSMERTTNGRTSRQ